MKKVLVSGYIGFDNFGDEAIFQALKSHLIKSGFCVCALSAKKYSDIKTYNYKNPFEIIKAIISCDILISGGGSLLQNKTSNISLIYYLLIIFISKLLFKKVIIFAQGIEPIKGKLFELLTENILKTADLITTRDKKSSDLIKSWGLDSITLSDPVYSILPEINTNKKGLIIQLRDCADNITDDLALAIKNNYKGEITLLALQKSKDEKICLEFVEKLKNFGLTSKYIYNSDVDKTLEILNNAKYVISTRLHGLMVANALKARVFALSYDDKTNTLVEELELENININKPENLIDKIAQFFATEKPNKDYRKFSFDKIDEVLNANI